MLMERYSRRSFNSRPHEEVDCTDVHALSLPHILSTHDLTKRSTSPAYSARISSTFQLTTSRRGRQISGMDAVQYFSFNSRPHEEVDRHGQPARHGGGLSTHDLTKRSTWEHGGVYITQILSTHDLTKRSTVQTAGMEYEKGPFNSRPHEEVDCNNSILINSLNPFNSRPHEEVDALVE